MAEFGHHIHKVWPKTLWFYRCMLRAHGQLMTVLEQDRTRKLQGKMKDVLSSLAKGESSFQPDRTWDGLLLRLFPEVADVWQADPSHVAKAVLRPPPSQGARKRVVEESGEDRFAEAQTRR